MNLRDDGTAFFKPGDGLVELIVIDTDLNDGSQSRESIYHPTDSDIQRACAKYRFNYEHVSDLIEKRDPGVHTLFIDAAVYRAQSF